MRTPRPAAPSAPVVQATAGPSAEFVAPLYVPAPPAGTPGPEVGTGVLSPDSVVTPAPAAPPHAVIRPA
ncbi:hypothetical protein GCM10023225_22040 [Kineococcus glutinatus]|uniref:Uncharacterized protein n=1 Tax=Kineococcus glutinatus TaxID=1070872 RepID=A0ABP9HYU1_9ACTN